MFWLHVWRAPEQAACGGGVRWFGKLKLVWGDESLSFKVKRVSVSFDWWILKIVKESYISDVKENLKRARSWAKVTLMPICIKARWRLRVILQIRMVLASFWFCIWLINISSTRKVACFFFYEKKNKTFVYVSHNCIRKMVYQETGKREKM